MDFYFWCLILYICWDFNYFLRCILTLIYAAFRKKQSPLEKTTIYGICTTQDIDIFWKHMNNARYLRELDFSRYHYFGVSGIYDQVTKHGGLILQGASSIRYRRAIPVFSPYKIETQLVWWDEKETFIEHKFKTFDGFVRAVVLSKQSITGRGNVLDMMKELGVERPEQPEELQLWIDSMKKSSEKLRKDN